MTHLAREHETKGCALRVRLRGVECLADVDIDVLEHARRVGVGAAGRPLGGLAVLDALLRLPEQVPVSVDRLDPETLAQIMRAPSALSYPTRDTVCRTGRPAAAARLVTIPTEEWRRGIQQAHRLAPYCARGILLAREPKHLGMLMLEAGYWGIGVQIRDGLSNHEVLAPAEFAPVRYTGAAWSFDEALYSQVSGQVHLDERV